MPLDLTRQTTGKDIAKQFGYGSEYGQYFSPMQEGLLESGTQAGWSGYKQAKRADIFQTGRRGLLDLTQQREMGHGGFAGRGATGREYGKGRSQLSQGLMQGMFGLEQDILGKIGTAQGRIEDWRERQQDVALRLAEMEAPKTEITTGRSASKPTYDFETAEQGPVSEQRLIRRGGTPDPNSPFGAALGDIMIGKDGKQYVWTTTGWQLDEGDSSAGGGTGGQPPTQPLQSTPTVEPKEETPGRSGRPRGSNLWRQPHGPGSSTTPEGGLLGDLMVGITTGRSGQTPDIYATGGGTQGPVSEQRLIRRGGTPDPNSPFGAALGDIMIGKDGRQYVWTTTGWQLDEGDDSGAGNP